MVQIHGRGLRKSIEFGLLIFLLNIPSWVIGTSLWGHILY